MEPNRYNSIRPGQIWLDTEGKRIQAHGGSVMYWEGAYYWYGENKEFTDPEKGIWHWGVRCYKSTDLYNWEDLGLIIPPNTEDPTSSIHPTSLMDRPHIIYNQKTGKFVCWLKIMHRDGTQDETVLTADALTGPYTIVREGLRPLNMSAGDFDLVVALPNGRPCEDRIILKEFAKLREDAGLPKVVFHSLRHSSTTYKLKLNHGDLKATQGDTGHAEIDMITSIYAHILDEDRKVNAQKFETAFYAKPDLRNVRPPEEPAKSEPATLDLESLVEQLQKSPELAKSLAALISAQSGGRSV